MADSLTTRVYEGEEESRRIFSQLNRLVDFCSQVSPSRPELRQCHPEALKLCREVANLIALSRVSPTPDKDFRELAKEYGARLLALHQTYGIELGSY